MFNKSLVLVLTLVSASALAEVPSADRSEDVPDQLPNDSLALGGGQPTVPQPQEQQLRRLRARGACVYSNDGYGRVRYLCP